MGVSSFIFHSAPIPPPSGKGSNTAIFGLTTFLLAASPCRVVRKKKRKNVLQPKKRLRFRKRYRRRLPRPLTVSPNINSQTYETEEVYFILFFIDVIALFFLIHNSLQRSLRGSVMEMLVHVHVLVNAQYHCSCVYRRSH